MLDFAAFQASFAGDILTPAHADYEASLTRWAANSRRRAAVVAFVRDEADVARALGYARGAGLGVAIRGGGHSSAGASSITDGLVVDLSRHMAGVRVDTDARLAHVGGGALWGTVNAETMKHGLATTGGTVSHVRGRPERANVC
jgi:FAD/FMN-containing dehydrogenase